MGLLGREIGEMTPVQRARITNAPLRLWPADGGTEAFVYPDGCKCLYGHAENWGYDPDWDHFIDWTNTKNRYPGYERFTELVARFGLESMVRAVQARATAEGLPDEDLAPAGSAR